MKMMLARFLSDTTHCPMVTSKSVCRMTGSDCGPGPVAKRSLLSTSVDEQFGISDGERGTAHRTQEGRTLIGISCAERGTVCRTQEGRTLRDL